MTTLFQYVPVCKAILRDAPPIDVFLSKMDAKIDGKSKTLWKNRNEAGMKFSEKVIDICEKNRAKIWYTKSENEKLLKKVQSSETKVKTALIW